MELPSTVSSKFVVLEFPEEVPITIQAVPTKWLINSTKCWYPSGRISSTALHKLLCDHNSEPQASWGKSQCRILGQFVTYKEAKEGEREAQEYSDIEIRVKDKLGASATEGTKRVPKRNSKYISSGDDTSNESLFPQSPLPKRLNQEQFHDKLPDLPAEPFLGLIQNESSEPVSISLPTSTIRFNPEIGNSFVLDLNHQLTPTSANQSSSFLHFPTPTFTDDQFTPTSSQKSDGFQRTVLKHLAAIISGQRDTLQKIDRIENRLEIVEAKLSGADKNQVLEESQYPVTTLPDFPLVDESQLQQLEETLCLDTEFKSLVRYLRGIGGSDLGDTVRKILRRIVDKPLSWRLTYTGKGNNKEAFYYPRLLRVISEAAKRNPLLPKDPAVTEGDVKRVIMNFFRFARPPKTISATTTPTNQLDN